MSKGKGKKMTTDRFANLRHMLGSRDGSARDNSDMMKAANKVRGSRKGKR